MNRVVTLTVILCLVLLTSCIVVESACPPGTEVQPSTDTRHELFEEDVLTLIDDDAITSNQVTVDGVGLGDSFQDLINAIGTPQVIDEYTEDNIINAKYENELDQTTYIFHFENDKVTRIVIRPGLNDRLPEGSKIDMDLSTITSRFGKPDFSEDVLLAHRGFRTYYYYPKGIELYHKAKKLIGYALVVPQLVPDDLNFNRYE